MRSDMACGSTIGPILASGLGCKTVDVGAPQVSCSSYWSADVCTNCQLRAEIKACDLCAAVYALNQGNVWRG